MPAATDADARSAGTGAEGRQLLTDAAASRARNAEPPVETMTESDLPEPPFEAGVVDAFGGGQSIQL
jgi:hypothetical protein